MTRLLKICFMLLTAAATAGDLEAVRCSEIAFSKAAESRNAEEFASYVDKDARFVGATVLRGIDEIVAAWAPYFADDGPEIRWRPQFVEVLASGDYAFSRGPYRITAMDERGDSVERWGTFNSVWRRNRDGRWRVVVDAGSAPDETPTDEQRRLLESENEECNVRDQ